MPAMGSRLRVNVGGGATPTPGWVNIDNSWTVRLARTPGLMGALALAGLVNRDQVEFARVARGHGILWADAARHIPLADGSVEVLYSSHMIEHLSPEQEAPCFLAEARRVLAPGGILRIAVPDLLRRARRYVEGSWEAGAFVESLKLADRTPSGKRAWLRRRFGGILNHRWMYDADSLIRLVERSGFHGALELPPGETTIPGPGPLNLREREEESIYVEAQRG